MLKQGGNGVQEAVELIFSDLFADKFAMEANVPGTNGNKKKDADGKIAFSKSRIFKLIHSK